MSKKYQIDGEHYLRHRIQPWDIIQEYELNFWEGNALKYLLRRKKNVSRITDLQKCRHYVEELIRQEEEKTLLPALPQQKPQRNYFWKSLLIFSKSNRCHETKTSKS